METIRKAKPTLNGKHVHVDQAKADLKHAKNQAENAGHAIGDAVGELWIEGKKLANALYEDGIQRLSATEHELEQYADHMMVNIKKNPLKSVLIAGGIGFLLAALLKK